MAAFMSGMVRGVQSRSSLDRRYEVPIAGLDSLVAWIGLLAVAFFETALFLLLEDVRTHTSWNLRSNASALGSIKSLESILEFLERDLLIAKLAALALARYDDA